MSADPRKGLPSASAAPRIRNCPGSLKAPRTVPPDDSTEDSRRGDRIHGQVAWQLAEIFCPYDNTFDRLDLDPEEQDAADRLTDRTVVKVREILGDQIDSVTIENRLWFTVDGEVGEVDLFSGQADFVAWSGNRGLIVDHKTGWGEQDENADHDQLRWLAVLHAQSGAEELIVWVNQLGNNAPPAMFDSAALDAATDQVIREIEAGNDPSAPRVAGEWCQYCPARIGCPARNEALVVMESEAADVTVPVLPDDVLAALVDRWQVVKRLGGELEAELKHRIEMAPTFWESRGWSLSEGRKVRNITDVSLVAERLNAAGVSYQQITAACSIPLKAIDTLTREATGLKGNGLAERVEEILDGAIEVKTTAPSLKRAKALTA